MCSRNYTLYFIEEAINITKNLIMEKIIKSIFMDKKISDEIKGIKKIIYKAIYV